MRFWLRTLVGAIVVVGIAMGGLSYAYWDQTVQIGSTAINYVRYWSAPAGTLETEVAQTGTAAQPASTASALPQVAPSGAAVDWPSYNKTLTSNRFSELSQINRTNAERLKVLCTYDTGAYTGFNSGLCSWTAR
jgi:alcohol dehydrogenase (cytochrome c)